MPTQSKILIRRGSEPDWNMSEEVLSSGELALDTNNTILKNGFGSKNWKGTAPLAASPIKLFQGCDLVNEVFIRSPVVDFTKIGDHDLFDVPQGYFFVIRSIEVVTINEKNITNTATFRFGRVPSSLFNDSEREIYRPPIKTTSNSSGKRHILEAIQDVIFSKLTVSFGITIPSVAEAHDGHGIVKGYFFRN